jgi:hypothetical protein
MEMETRYAVVSIRTGRIFGIYKSLDNAQDKLFDYMTSHYEIIEIEWEV